uniref:histidine kinase n=1 Tax=Eiseniibacteriota bacterium TaxID=2212470 RepID=A0A832IBW5_UNCEI
MDRNGGARRPGTRVVVAALAAAGALLAWSTWLEIRAGAETAERLMLAQAGSIADLVRESGTHGFETYQRWEDEVAARLFDNARWVARRDAQRRWTDRELARLADEHRLGRINLFDAAGRKTATSRLEPEESPAPKHDPRDFIGPVLRGEVAELRIGFKEARFRGGLRFAVAVARPGGGAVVVNVFADSMRAALENMQPAHVLGALGSARGIRYVVLVRGDSVLAATPDSVRAAALPPLPTPAAGGPTVFEGRSGLGRVYEVSSAIALAGTGPALLRVGLDPGPLDRARAAARARAVFRAVVAGVVAALTAGLLLVWQRQAVLAREVASARVELEARAREAERTARLAAMGELAAHVAHEIRNPLNTIQLTAQEMARDPGLGGELRARAEDLRAESRRIEAIVQQFLDLARPRRPRLEVLDAGAAVAAAARAAAPAFRDAGVELAVTTEPVVARLDPQWLGEIVENLLRNAREASARGGRVALDVRRRGAEVRIVVDDEGCGVPPELRERVFDLFYTTKPRGSGLGLSIVAQLAAAMGGGVRLEERAGAGARFVVHLPAEARGA